MGDEPLSAGDKLQHHVDEVLELLARAQSCFSTRPPTAPPDVTIPAIPIGQWVK